VTAPAAAVSGRGPAPGTPPVLAIDGGNSKTDVALIGWDGAVLGVASGGGSNHQTAGRERALAVLTELVCSARLAAGQPAGGTGPIAQHTSACLAGADLPEEEAELGAVVQAQGWSVTSAVVNDTFAVLRAGLDDASPEPCEGSGGQHWGIGVVCGAGINCVGVAPDGRTTRFLALGHLSGDWGGGGSLARDAMWWAIRAEDGRGPQTELRAAVAAHFGVPEVRDVVTGIYFATIAEAELHGLVPVLLQVASRGDKVARSIVQQQAEEICLMVTAAARNLGLTGTELPVVLGGSVLTARDPGLTSAIYDRLAAALPGCEVRIVDVPPIAGAALLGLDHVGAPPAAAVQLRLSAAETWPTASARPVVGASAGPGGLAGSTRWT
jgi:N-acetylglucosamine kinase-like BadF-type ATPase